MSTTIAERAWCVVIPHHARGAHLARHRLADELDTLVAPDRLDDAIAIAAELIGNAVRHAAPLPGDVIRVAWRLIADGTLEIRVTDGGAQPGPPAATCLDERLDESFAKGFVGGFDEGFDESIDGLLDARSGVAGPRLRSAGPDAIDGRGLTIVAALATGWGVERDGLGQCVWAKL